MVGSHIRLHDWLELAVMLFQVLGVLTLLMTRLLVNTRWSGRMRLVFMVAMLGLGICGAWCGQNDSEFGLFAGGTMTASSDWHDDRCGFLHGGRRRADSAPREPPARRGSDGWGLKFLMLV